MRCDPKPQQSTLAAIGCPAHARGVRLHRQRHHSEHPAACRLGRSTPPSPAAAAECRQELTAAPAVRWTGWYIITYGLGIYVLNLLIGFLSPQADPESEGSMLPTSKVRLPNREGGRTREAVGGGARCAGGAARRGGGIPPPAPRVRASHGGA